MNAEIFRPIKKNRWVECEDGERLMVDGIARKVLKYKLNSVIVK